MGTQQRRRWWIGLVVGLVAAAVLAAGCGSSSHPDLQKPGPLAAKDDGQDGAILAAYRGSLADFNAVEDHDPVMADDPLLGRHMTGTKLTTVRSALATLAAHDQFAGGSLRSLSATVSQFNGREAVIVSCELDTTYLRASNSLKAIDDPSDTTELVNEEVTLSAQNLWLVSEGSKVRAGCDDRK